jgi:hypothetical protein
MYNQFSMLLETTLSGTELRLHPVLFLHLPSLFYRLSRIGPQFGMFSALTLPRELTLTLSIECCLRYQYCIQATNNLNCHTSPQALLTLARWKLLELAA